VTLNEIPESFSAWSQHVSKPKTLKEDKAEKPFLLIEDL